jgi:hypothetical protein
MHKAAFITLVLAFELSCGPELMGVASIMADGGLGIAGVGGTPGVAGATGAGGAIAAGGSGGSGGGALGQGGSTTTNPVVPPAPVGPPLYPPATVESLSLGEIKDATGNFVLWLPPGVQRLRGLVFLNMTQGGYYQEAGQRQLASTWGFAHLTGMAWNNNLAPTFDIDLDVLERVITELAQKSGHPELSVVPMVGVGLSRTGGTGFAMAKKWKSRLAAHAMIAAAFPRGPSPDSAGIPSISVVGDQDNYDAALTSFLDFRPRDGGMLVATAINRGVGHKCGPCNQVIWPFFDRIVRQRLKTSDTLEPVDVTRAWLGNTQDWTTATAAAYRAAPERAAWLPDSSVANAWQGFTIPNPPATFEEPRNDLGYASKAKAGAVNVQIKYTGGTDDTLRLFDGDVDIGELPKGAATRRMTVMVQPGLHVFIVMKDGKPISRPTGGLYVRP